MMFRIDRIRWLPLALLMCLWNVDSLSAFFKTTSVPSTTASSTTITASTATRRGFFARSIYASYSHRLSRRHATSSSFEKDDEYVNIPEEWKQYVKTSSEERTKQFTDFEPSSTDMITTTGTTILTTPNGEISTKEAPNYLVDTDVNEKSGLEDEEEEANERMQVDALVDLYEELIGIINYMLDLYHTQELYNLPEKLMKKLEDRAYVLFIGNDIYQSSMTAALSQHPVGSKNYEGIRSVMEFIDEYLLFQQRSRLKYKLNYLILGAVIGKLDDAIMLLSESQEITEDLLIYLRQLMDKERHRHREADILLKEQQEVETFDPMLKSTQTASIDYALSYAGSAAGEASSPSDVTEASSNTIQTTDSPALKILKALEQRLKVEIIKFQGQEYYKLIGDLYLQPDAAAQKMLLESRLTKVEDVYAFITIVENAVDYYFSEMKKLSSSQIVQEDPVRAMQLKDTYAKRVTSLRGVLLEAKAMQQRIMSKEDVFDSTKASKNKNPV